MPAPMRHVLAGLLHRSCPGAFLLALGLGAAMQGHAARLPQADDLATLSRIGSVLPAPEGEAVLVSVAVPDASHDTYRTQLWLIQRSSDGALQSQQLDGMADAQWSPDGRDLHFIGEDQGRPAWRARARADGAVRTLLVLPHVPDQLSISPSGRRVAFLAGRVLAPPAWAALPVRPAAEQRPVVVDHVPFRTSDGSIVPNRELRLYAGDLDTGQVRSLDVPADASLSWTETGGPGDLAWTGDEQALIVSVARGFDTRYRLWNRNRDLLRLPLDGTAPRWVVEDPRVETSPRVSPDGRWLAYLRQRGAPHGTVFHHELVVRDLVHGREWLPLGDRDVNPASHRWLPHGGRLVVGYLERAQAVLAEVTREGGHEEVARGRTGLTLQVGGDGTMGMVGERHDQPPEAVTRSPDGRWQVWTDANAAVRGRRWARLQEIEYPSAHADGRAIHALVATPQGVVDPRRLPVVIDLHGGPYSASTTGFDPTREFFASQGYVVVQPNYRGSIGYGDAFSRISDRRHYPGWYDRPDAPHEMGMDVVGALRAVAEQGLGDPGQVYLRGVSAGALLTTWTLGRTDGFRAAVAQSWYPGEWGAPDYGYYQLRQYFEGLPWEPAHQPEFWRRNVIMMAGRIRTPLLLIQGERDWITPPHEELEKFYYALRTRSDVAIVYYPNETHGLRRHPASLRNALLQEHAWFRHHGSAR